MLDVVGDPEAEPEVGPELEVEPTDEPGLSASVEEALELHALIANSDAASSRIRARGTAPEARPLEPAGGV